MQSCTYYNDTKHSKEEETRTDNMGRGTCASWALQSTVTPHTMSGFWLWWFLTLMIWIIFISSKSKIFHDWRLLRGQHPSLGPNSRLPSAPTPSAASTPATPLVQLLVWGLPKTLFHQKETWGKMEKGLFKFKGGVKVASQLAPAGLNWTYHHWAYNKPSVAIYIISYLAWLLPSCDVI